MVAFSIDSILPALPEIASTLVPENVNRAQLLISAFVIGAGAGQLFFGAAIFSVDGDAALYAGSLRRPVGPNA